MRLDVEVVKPAAHRLYFRYDNYRQVFDYTLAPKNHYYLSIFSNFSSVVLSSILAAYCFASSLGGKR